MQDNQDLTPKQKTVEQLRQANNVVVTTGKNPSIDQVAAVLALVKTLQKLDKQVVAVVSGDIPAQLDFLKPRETVKSKLDAIRDFIIELDTSKTQADKFRYNSKKDKLEIFITPFNGSYSKDDITTREGSFNVDVVAVLGVSDKDDLDPVIATEESMLHKAEVILFNPGSQVGGFGNVSWHDEQAGSLSEMLVSLNEALQSGLDEDIAEQLLTGLVAVTDRFSNGKTTPKVMTMAAQLMAAGANQQKIIENMYGANTPRTEKEAATSENTTPQANQESSTTTAPSVSSSPSIEYQPMKSEPTPDQAPTRDTAKVDDMPQDTATSPQPVSGNQDTSLGQLPGSDDLSARASQLLPRSDISMPETPSPQGSPDGDAGQPIETEGGSSADSRDPLEEARRAVQSVVDSSGQPQISPNIQSQPASQQTPDFQVPPQSIPQQSQDGQLRTDTPGADTDQ